MIARTIHFAETVYLRQNRELRDDLYALTKIDSISKILFYREIFSARVGPNEIKFKILFSKKKIKPFGLPEENGQMAFSPCPTLFSILRDSEQDRFSGMRKSSWI